MDTNNIDLRSDEIKAILGRVPSRVTRWGSAIITTILISVCIILLIIKTPDKITGLATITTVINDTSNRTDKTGFFSTALLEIPQENYQKVKVGMPVFLKFSSLNYQNYGLLKGYVASVADSIERNGKFYVRVRMEASENPENIKYPKYGMTGTGEIILGKGPMLKKFFSGDSK